MKAVFACHTVKQNQRFDSLNCTPKISRVICKSYIVIDLIEARVLISDCKYQ